MIFTDVVFADGTFHTLRSVVDERPAAVPRHTVQFDDHPVITLIPLICGRLAAGGGRLVAVGLRHDGQVVVLNDEGRSRLLGPSFGTFPVAIRYVEGLFEIFVVRDAVAWLKYYIDGDLNEGSEPVILTIPPEVPPGAGILDLVDNADEAIWGTSEIELPYRKTGGAAVAKTMLGGWMTRGQWTVGFTVSSGIPVVVNLETGNAYALISGVSSTIPPRVAVDDQGRPKFALSIEGADVAVFGFEDIEQAPLPEPQPQPELASEDLRDAVPAGPGDAAYDPRALRERAAQESIPFGKPGQPLDDTLRGVLIHLQGIHGQINLLTTAIDMSLRTIDSRLTSIRQLAEAGMQTAHVQGFVGTVKLFGKDFDVTLKATPHATASAPAAPARPDHPGPEKVDRDVDRPDPAGG